MDACVPSFLTAQHASRTTNLCVYCESVSASERQETGKTRNRCHGKREHDRGGPHPQGTHTEERTPQRTHHRRGGPHRGPTQNTHSHVCPCLCTVGLTLYVCVCVHSTFGLTRHYREEGHQAVPADEPSRLSNYDYVCVSLFVCRCLCTVGLTLIFVFFCSQYIGSSHHL